MTKAAPLLAALTLAVLLSGCTTTTSSVVEAFTLTDAPLDAALVDHATNVSAPIPDRDVDLLRVASTRSGSRFEGTITLGAAPAPNASISVVWGTGRPDDQIVVIVGLPSHREGAFTQGDIRTAFNVTATVVGDGVRFAFSLPPHVEVGCSSLVFAAVDAVVGDSPLRVRSDSAVGPDRCVQRAQSPTATAAAE